MLDLPPLSSLILPVDVLHWICVCTGYYLFSHFLAPERCCVDGQRAPRILCEGVLHYTHPLAATAATTTTMLLLLNMNSYRMSMMYLKREKSRNRSFSLNAPATGTITRIEPPEYVFDERTDRWKDRDSDRTGDYRPPRVHTKSIRGGKKNETKCWKN